MSAAEFNDIQDVRHVEGGDDARPKLEAWLDKELSKNPEHDDDLMVVLHHLAGGREHAIWRQALHHGEDVGEFVDELLDEAETDCLRNRGRNKYSVEIKGRDGRKRFDLKSPPLRTDEDPEFSDDFDDEPTTRGALALTLRHIEKKEKSYHELLKLWRDDVQEEKRDLRREVQMYRAEDSERRARDERVRSMEFMREMEIRKAKKREERADHALDEAITLGKRIARKHFNLPEPPMASGPAAPIEAQLIGFLKGLREDQLKNLGLDETQQRDFAAIFQHLSAWQFKQDAGRNDSTTSNATETHNENQKKEK